MKEPPGRPPGAPGVVFLVALVSLIVLIVLGYTPFRAVSIALVCTLLAAALKPSTRMGPRSLLRAVEGAAHGGVSLIAAAACVGIIIGVVTLTGIGARLPGAILPLAQDNLVLALILLMGSTIILGMGLPSAVCYLLMATLVGPVLGELGVVPLAAHMFIFYFGMMSMVTPPVALAAYTAAAIAKADIMRTGLAAFRFALVGFALPYAFVLHPELLLVSPDLASTVVNVLVVFAGILPLAAAISGYGFAPLNAWQRAVLLVAALVLFLTPSGRSSALDSGARRPRCRNRRVPEPAFRRPGVFVSVDVVLGNAVFVQPGSQLQDVHAHFPGEFPEADVPAPIGGERLALPERQLGERGLITRRNRVPHKLSPALPADLRQSSEH